MDSGTIVLPRRAATPFRSAGRRLLVALGVLVTIATVVWLDGDGYSDVDNRITWFDALYYATVSASTTGYGDIAPVTDQARLVNVLLVTPMRVLFVVALIGSAFEVVTTTARTLYRRRTAERSLQGHTVVVGYGTRGRAAVAALLDAGTPRTSIVAIDRDATAVSEAVSAGIASVHGDATRDGVQQAAHVADARDVLIAVSSDASSVLAALTSRRLTSRARIIASVREAENAPLLHAGGASTVVVSSDAAGRMLGLAVSHPPAAAVLGDLLTPREALGLRQRPVAAHEVGRPLREADDLVLAVLRDGERLPYHHPGCGPLREGDDVVVITSAPSTPASGTTS